MYSLRQSLQVAVVEYLGLRSPHREQAVSIESLTLYLMPTLTENFAEVPTSVKSTYQ